MPRCTVLLVKSDDFAWFGLSAALRTMDDVRVLAEPMCPDRARGLAAELRPDLIFSSPRVNGVPMPRVLIDLQRGPCPAAKIVFVGAIVDPDDIAATADLRYDGWLLWPELSAEGLPHVLQAIVFGEARVGSPSIVDALFAQGRQTGPTVVVPAERPVRLSPRERAVLKLLATEGDEELTFSEIGHRLGMKASSVATYVERVGIKLEVGRGGRRAVQAAAHHRGLLAPPGATND